MQEQHWFVVREGMSEAMAGVRAYVRELRLAQGVSQEELAKAIQLSLRAFIDWERGVTGDIKSGPLMRAITYLRGSPEDVRYLITEDATEEEGRRLVQVLLTREQHKTIDRLVNEERDNELEEIIRNLQADMDEVKRRLGLP